MNNSSNKVFKTIRAQCVCITEFTKSTTIATGNKYSRKASNGLISQKYRKVKNIQLYFKHHSKHIPSETPL